MSNSTKVLVASTAFAALCVMSSAHAAFFPLPRMLKNHTERLVHFKAALPPLAHSRFCLRYPADCERLDRSEYRAVSLTEESWTELVRVNHDVNRSIVPQRNMGGVLTEEWLLSPAAGDCNDYAVTKRHELLARGWPSSTLILAEVVTTWGEHHLVLVVRTMEGDFVLDNINRNVLPIAMTRYRWVRAQSPDNPKFWASIRIAAPVPVAQRMRAPVRLAVLRSRASVSVREALSSAVTSERPDERLVVATAGQDEQS
jgi:predicted transglutaminase-like cysteine proteinase